MNEMITSVIARRDEGKRVLAWEVILLPKITATAASFSAFSQQSI